MISWRSCLLLGLAVLGAACSSTGPYVWVDSLPPTSMSMADNLLIQDGDAVNVRVFNQEQPSTKERVRSDGKISMPVIGEVGARGKSPSRLASEIQEKLKAVVVAPSVTVTLDAGAELKVSVVGEVRNSGVFQL